MELIEFISEYWHILTGIISIVVLFVKLILTTNNQEKRICKLEEEVGDLNPIFLDIRERLISIETTLKLHIENDSHRTKQQ